MKKLLTCCAMAAAFVAVPASAQWYAGVGVGSSKIDGAGSGLDSSKTSAKLYGGYQITPTWGAEAQYTDLGKREAPGVSIKPSQYSLAGTGTFPVSQSFSLMGKLGVTRNRVDVSGGNNENKSDLLVGVGVSYAITPKMAVRLEYEDFGKLSSNGSVRANNYSLNLQYAF